MAIAQLQNILKPEQEAEAERIALELKAEHDRILAEMEHQHQMELEQMKAEFAAQQAERQHEHALEAGDQGIAGQMAVQAVKPETKGKK